MGRDKSMGDRTPKWIDDRAKKNPSEGKYDPPYSWFPGKRESKGTQARDGYDSAYKHHSSRNKKK